MGTGREFARDARHRRRCRRWWWLGFSLLLGFALVVGVILWLNRPQNVFAGVKIQADSTIEGKIAERVASDALAERYPLGLKKSNRLFYPRRAIEADIRRNLPKVARITFQPTRDTLLITLEARRAAYLWCQTGRLDCQFMDEAGVVFAVAPQFVGPVYFEFGSETVPLLGEQVLTAVDLNHWLTLKTKLEQLLVTSPLAGLVPYRLDFWPEGDFTFWLGKDNRLGPHIRGNEANLEDFLPNLLAVFSSEQWLTRASSTTPELEYLDLRFGDKVFYKQTAGAML